jgi:hypothetical protein
LTIKDNFLPHQSLTQYLRAGDNPSPEIPR